MLSKNQRNTNLELLRIISMFFIIAHHFVVHGMKGIDFVIMNPNSYVLYFLAMFGKIGVGIFVLISSYFMIESKFTLRKLLVLGGEVYFYSFLFLAIAIIFLNPEYMTIGTIGKSILPISHNGYWFITCFIVLMLFSPVLNQCIKKLSKNTLIKTILLAVLIWSIFPTIFPAMTSYPVQTVFVGNNFQYSPLIWFFVLYLIGSYIRLYLDLDKLVYSKLIWGFILSIVIIFVGTCIFSILDLNSTAHLWWGLSAFDIADGSLYRIFSLENNFFVLIASLCLFLIFLKRKEFSNKYINYLAGSTLGVYLIHCNCFGRVFAWNTFLKPSYYNSPNLLLIGLVLIFIVYIVCSGIDNAVNFR
jgi:surface polysaccharide O-acyltransferase-like enzyme